MANDKGVDHEAIKRIRDSMGEAFARMAAVFVDAARANIDAIDTACDDGDIDTVKRETHSLKSSSAMIGSPGLSQLAIDLEILAGDGHLPGAESLVEAMRKELFELESALLGDSG